MRKKFVIFGLVLLLGGAAALIWVLTEQRKERRLAASYKLKYASEADEYLKQYNEWSQLPPQERPQLPWGLSKYGETRTEIQLRREQQERLKADLDKLAAGETDVHPFADIIYGESWQKELSKYKTRNKMRELTITASTTCMLVGGTISAGCLLSWTAALAALGLGHFRKFSTDVFRWCKETKNKLLYGADATKEHSKALIKSGWQNFNKNYANRHEPRPLRQRRGEPAPAQIEAGCEDSRRLPEQGCSGSETAFSMRSGPCPDDAPSPSKGLDAPENTRPVRNSTMGDMTQKGEISNGAQNIAVLLSDEKSVEFEGTPNALEDFLETQTEDFEKQVQEIKQMAQRVQQAAVVRKDSIGEHSGPLNNTLVELTQQVSAIREYASNQQDRVKKLQEGYDWNIIKTFCLRVIRCIDNLENRISRLSEQDVKTPNLEEIKDELVFALESSGVERFEPEINSDYRGQEKSVEAVKEKESSNDPNLTGKIAKVIRPGYQYFIDEENVKVVRTAQVKLFG